MDDLEIVRHRVAEAMEQIMKNFKGGAKITVFVRRPDTPDHSQDFLMGDDDPLKAAEAIHDFILSQTTKVTPPD